MELIRLNASRWADERGHIKQPWNMLNYNAQAISSGHSGWPLGNAWVQDNVTVSHRHVLRGIHGYRDVWRLCACVFGKIYFVVADCRDGTGFGQWTAVNFSADSASVLVPPGFGMAALTLSELSVFYYKWSGAYKDHQQFEYKWNDPRLGIRWPIDAPILSERDK